MSSLYIHIPFCKKACNYCDFYKQCPYDNSQLDSYLAALETEMEFRRDFLAGEPVKTIFFGGGTPSVCKPSSLQKLIDKARTLWDLTGLVEATVEVNPDDATQEYMNELAATDINRISLGVQSFIDRDLALLGRRHTAAQSFDAIQAARSAGFRDISIDLIYGIPGQSMKEWDWNLMRAMSLGVEHISAYHLTVEPDTQLAKMVDAGQIEPVDESTSEAQFAMIHKLLTQAGFDHYEISNYARTPANKAKHNSGYWEGAKYLGLGPSAHSYDGKHRREFVVASLEEYMKGVGTDSVYGYEELSNTDKYNEFVMVSLRTSRGLRRDQLCDLFGLESLLYFEYAADKFLRQGLLVREGNKYIIPPERLMVSDAIIRELFAEKEN